MIRINVEEIKCYKCGNCGAAFVSKEKAEDCCKPKICEDCGREIPRKSYYVVCDECREKRELQREKDRYNKATKCSYDECPDDEKIMMYSESYGSNEGYFTDISELIDYCEAEDIPVPEYCWSTTQIDMSMDGDSLIESACEELFEDASDRIDSEDRKGLQDFLDKWCEKQSGTSTYSVDYKYAVKVEK